MVLLGEKGYFQEGFLGSDMNQTQQVFLDGEAAMIIDGTWNSALFFDAPGLDVDCLIPPWNAAGQDFVAVLGSEAGWSIAAGGNETLSKALLDHMCYDSFDVYQHKCKGISPFKPNSKYILDARMGIYIESLSGASISVGLASHVMPPAVFAEAMKLCQEMYTGKTPAEVPAQLAKLQSEYIDQKTK